MLSLFPRKNKLERLQHTYKRHLKRSYQTASFNQEESRRAQQDAEQVLSEIQSILVTMVIV